MVGSTDSKTLSFDCGEINHILFLYKAGRTCSIETSLLTAWIIQKII